MDNAAEFIKAGASVISVGSDLEDKKAVAQAQFEVITRKAEQFIEEVRKARGMNPSNRVILGRGALESH